MHSDAVPGYSSRMRLGVLDIGSNSAQLQIVDAAPGAPPLPIHAIKEPVLLGEEITDEGTISDDGTERVALVVASVLEAAYRFEVDQLYPFVTAAIRDAGNREQVLDRIERESGIRPQYLSGEQEARLTYLAVHRWYGWSAGRLLILDIGGGSMEIALGRDAQPEMAVSLPLGAGRLTRGYFSGDPPARREMKALRRYVRDILRDTADRLHWEGIPRFAVGSSKTFKQLARLTGAPPQRKGPFVRRTLCARDVRTVIPRLAALPAHRRAELPGVSVPRARQILAGAMVAYEAMCALDIAKLEVSPWALREGVILQHLSTITDPTNTLPLQPLVPRPQGTAPATPATVTVLPRQS